MTTKDREHLAIGSAVERAARYLPHDWEVRIEVERHAGTVRLFDPKGTETLIDGGDTFSEQINQAIDMAITSHEGEYE